MTLGSCRGKRGSLWRGVIGAIMLEVIVWTGTPAIAEERSPTTSENVALEVTSWLLTAPYGAVKAAYAIGGSLVGGFAWIGTGGNTQVARSIWVPAVTGDYIIRPENLSGDRPLHFVGKGK